MNKVEQLYENMFSIFEAVYKCISCGYEEQSDDITPKLMMQGVQASCSNCGAKTEAVWGHTSLPGYVAQPSGHSLADKTNKVR